MDDLATLDADAVHEVFGFILRGGTEHQILAEIRQRWPEQEARPLILAAMAKIADTGESDPASLKGWCIEATRYIYQLAIGNGDLDCAMRAIAQIHKLSK